MTIKYFMKICAFLFVLLMAAPSSYSQTLAPWEGSARQALFNELSADIDRLNQELALNPLPMIPMDPASQNSYKIHPSQRQEAIQLIKALNSSRKVVDTNLSGLPILPSVPIAVRANGHGKIEIVNADGMVMMFNFKKATYGVNSPLHRDYFETKFSNLDEMKTIVTVVKPLISRDVFVRGRNTIPHSLKSESGLYFSAINFEDSGWNKRSATDTPIACQVAQRVAQKTMYDHEVAVKGTLQSMAGYNVLSTISDGVKMDQADGWEEKKNIYYQSDIATSAGTLMEVGLAGGMEPYLRAKAKPQLTAYGRCLGQVAVGWLGPKKVIR